MYVLRFIQRFRDRVGMPFISKENVRNAVRDSGRWLRRGGIVSFYVDQHAGRGARALFFGHPVRVPEGAAVFARKYGCPVVGIFSWRNDDGRHTVVVEGPYHLRKTGNAPADIQENTEYFIHRVQVHVAAHPEQWFTWLTRRFR